VTGSDGLDWIYFDDYQLARLIGTIALALILFEGGLATRGRDAAPAPVPGRGIATRSDPQRAPG
jgi:cell volume regulation protein A